MKVNSTESMITDLKERVEVGKSKMWLIGEHTSEENWGYTHGAYESGVNAAKEAVSL